MKLELELREPKPHEIGLLLLLIKDLWTGDLPIGGTSSIGRGRLQGKEATITWRREWTILQSLQNEFLVVNDAESLEQFVVALHEELNK